MNIRLDSITSFFTKGDKRTLRAKKNILALIVIKGINILTGFLVVPLTIHYVSASTYGIWLAISSIVIWISYFDLGLPNGFRNKFAESVAQGDYLLAKKYVSTTYVLLALIFVGILTILIISNLFINWSSLLHVDSSLKRELHYVFLVICIFFSIRVVASVFTFMLMADQRPALSAATQTIGQVLALATIYILTITTQSNLLYLAFAIAGIPCFAILAISFLAYRIKPYKRYAPSFRMVDFYLTKNILGIGIQFFIVTIINLLILQVINVVVSRELGPMAVTQYNISFKYFSVVYMTMELIVAPFWSGFTEAYTKKDFRWMDIILKKLELILVLSIPITLLMFLGTDFVIYLWIGDDVIVPHSLAFAMSIFVFFQSAYCMYSNLVNGTGKVGLQLVAFILMGLISIPVIVYTTRNYGLWGCMLLPVATYAIIALLCRIQIKKIIHQNIKGIWNMS